MIITPYNYMTKTNLPSASYFNGRVYSNPVGKHTEIPSYKKGTCLFSVEGSDYAAKTRGHLDSHITHKHSEERPYKCPHEGCDYAAKSKGDLESHVTFKHTTDRPFKCPHENCDYKGAKMQYELNQHLRRFHSNERPYKCPDCDYAAKTSGDLSVHLKSDSCAMDNDKATRQGHQWEDIGKEIAEILLDDEQWVWKPMIELPNVPDYNFVQPDIVIYDENNRIKKIIDLKRSPVSIHTVKDLRIYPSLCRHVSFWFLFAEEDLSLAFGFRTSHQIIRMLEEKKNSNPKLKAKIDHLIRKIRLCYEGLDPNSVVLDDFV